MKKEIAKAPLLAYNNPKKQTVLQKDASIKGLGACLLQEEQPVYFACKALTEALKWYVTIELESYSCCMGHGEISPFLVHKQLYIRYRSEAFGGNLVQEFKSSHPQITEDFNQNISISFHSVLHPWFDKPTCWLLVPVRMTERYNQSAKLHLYKITKQLSTRSDSFNQFRLATQEDDETHHHTRLAKHHPGCTKCNTSLLDFPWRTYCRRWVWYWKELEFRFPTRSMKLY